MYKIFDVPQRWRTPIIQGYFYVEEQDILEGTTIKIGILSRRQYKRGGTRLNARGIDDEGYVGNYVETESFLILQDILYIFTQVRGSIPLFWKQEGLKGMVKFKRDPANSLKAVRKHFKHISEDYSRILMVNLLKEKSEREEMLSINIKNIVEDKKLELGEISYFHFDFHSHGIKNLKWILEGTEEFVKSNGYYAENLKTGEVLRYQSGIVRTNWMDCLDRTNFAQTKIYLYSLQKQLEDAGIDLSLVFADCNLSDDGIAFADIPKEKPIVFSVNSFWADNGDFISLHYTGTNSTITRVMKEGKKGFLSTINHKYQDVARFVNNNFTDNFKEECIRMILGRSRRSKPIQDKEECDIDDKLPNVHLSIITWNLGNWKTDHEDEIKKSMAKFKNLN